MRKSKIWDILGAVGIFAGIVITSYSWATTFSDSTPIISDWRLGLGIGLFIFIFSTLMFVYKLYGASVWSEPNIIVSTKIERKFLDNDFCYFAQLVIYNDENLPITECYATLLSAEDIFKREKELATLPIIPSMSNKTDRIKWEDDKYSNERCEITIPANFHKELNVADTFDDFHFNLCSGEIRANWMIGAKLHTVKIRIDGAFNERSIKPQFFEGHIYSERKTYHSEVTETENGEIIDKRVVEIPYIDIAFFEGSWIKNKKLRKQLRLEDEG